MPSRKAVAGRTPIATTTRSASRLPPSQRTPVTRSPSVSRPVTSAPSTTSAPASRRAALTRSDISSSSMDIPRPRVRTVTRSRGAGRPRRPRRRCSPPRRRPRGRRRRPRRSGPVQAAPSSRVLTAPTPSYAVPSGRSAQSGTTAGEPVATTSSSYSTTSPESGRDGACGQVGGDHLGAHPQVDPRLAVLVGGAGDQVVARVDVAGHPVRDPAGAVRRVGAPVEHGDRELATGAPCGAQRLVGRRHPGGVGADTTTHADSCVPGCARSFLQVCFAQRLTPESTA